MDTNMLLLIGAGMLVGVGASFSGLGGGFLVVPLLLYLGYNPQRAVGTAFVTIMVISLSAVFAHIRMGNVDVRTGFLLGLGGVIGAQVGPRLLSGVSTGSFRKIFATVLLGLAVYVFFRK